MALALPSRPLFRGQVHLLCAVIAPFALLALLIVADRASEYVATAIFGAGLVLMYSASASYHVAPWPARLRPLAKRFDHAMIFVFIAATYAPFCLLALTPAWGIPLLSVVSGLAFLGVVLKVAWPGAPRWLGVTLYLALGWLGVVAVWPVVTSLPTEAVALMLLGGVLYSAGGVVYAKKLPDPWPRIFGYHEVFHVLVVAASASFYAAVMLYLLPS